MANQVKNKADEEKQFAFSKKNYFILIIGLLLIAIGFLLMIGGESENPQEFNYAIFNFQRLTLAPIIILAGLVVEIFAIMWRPKSSN
jgi:formate-dependent nitrite reductase membrane component NrfD